MTTFAGSPTSGKVNSFIDRYVQSLNSESISGKPPPLKPLSPLKMNSADQIFKTPIKGSKQSILSPSPDNKENISSLNRSPVLINLHESTLLPAFKQIPTKVPSTLGTADTSDFSKTELRYYEFLCRVGEVKRWIEDLIDETLPSEIELCTGDVLRNGVYLAQITQTINPDLVPSIFPAGHKLQFKHTQNINAFLSLVEHVGVPDSFRFELQDLYNKKDLPQVFETLHILITMINRKWPDKTREIGNLSGQLSFKKEELRKCERSWPRIRDFKSLGSSQLSPSGENSKKGFSSGLIKDFTRFKHPKFDSVILSPPTTPKKDPNISLNRLPAEIPLEDRTIPVSANSLPLRTTPNLNILQSPSPTFKTRNINTPRLQYSPIKNMSLQYYSPTLSKYLTYDSDFYLRRSENRELALQYYDTYDFTESQYSPKRKEKMTEYEFLERVIEIQNHCRGVNVRFEIFMQRRLLKLFEKDVIKSQSFVRGALKRRFMGIHVNNSLNEDINMALAKFQSLIKSNHIRYKYDKLRIQCVRREHIIEHFQIFAKGAAIRKLAIKRMEGIKISYQPLTLLQAHIRGSLIRSLFVDVSFHHDFFEDVLVTVQATLKGHSKRLLLRSMQTKLENAKISKLQTVFRSRLVRKRINQLNSSIDYNIINLLSAKLMGYRIRKFLNLIEENGICELGKITSIQSIIRGILVRYTLDLVDDIVENNGVSNFQGCIRGFQLRMRLNKSTQFFKRKEESIIKIQSWIRMHLQQSAYQEIVECPNPSLWAVRKFTYLLNNCGTIEDVQNKLETCQASLDAENLKRDNLQKLIRKQLEMYEVLEDNGLDGQLQNRDIVQKLHIPESNYPGLEKLFYLLQVNPLYWKTLYKQNPEFVEKNVYLTFTTLNKRMGEREKVYFTRFLSEIMQLSVASCKNISDFLTSYNQSWERQLKLFLKREYPQLSALFTPLADFITNPTIDFECNPFRIYEKIYQVKVSNGISPIEDEEVKQTFVENLKHLWHSVELVADIFARLHEKIPIEVRFLCTKIFGYAADKNANELDSIRSVSKILIDCFIGEYIQSLEYYGFPLHHKENTEKKIDVFLSTLRNVFEIRNFEGYFDPLNQYLNEIKPHIRNILYNVMIEPEYEQDGDRLIYKDMISDAPSLEVLAEKAKEICEGFIENSHSYPDKDIIQDILKMNASWGNFPKSGRILFHLDASVYRFLVADDQMRKLYDQVKRSIIYMTQIEEVDTNLYDLVVSNVLPSDEPLFSEFLCDNEIIKSDPLINNLETCTYFELKNATLKKIHDLEMAGAMSSADNKLQNLLNDIANTIKNPNYAIDYVTHELETTRQTLKLLSENNLDSERKLTYLQKTVHQIIYESQKSRNFIPAHKSTLGNLKSAYKNLQHKNNAEFSGLTFKWSTRQLYEKGVVRSIAQEKLGQQTVKVFGSSGPKYPDIVFKMSTPDGSKFGIKMIDKRKSTEKKHSESMDSFTFTDLIKSQAGTKVETWEMLNSSVVFNTNNLLKLVVDSFLS